MGSIPGRLRLFTLVILVLIGVVALMLAYGSSHGISWSGLLPSPCYPGCFCEAFRPGSISQPQSSYSNIWYILAGLGIAASARIQAGTDKTRTNLMLRHPGLTVAFGIAVIFVGLTSFFYHVSLTLVGRWLDYLGMYAAASFALVYTLVRLRIVRFRSFGIVYVLLLTGLAIPMVAPSSLAVKRAILLGLILAVLASEVIVVRLKHPRRLSPVYMVSAVGILAAATMFNLLDESGRWCHPYSFWQWHAAWHFLTAAVLGMLYMYYRLEDDGGRV